MEHAITPEPDAEEREAILSALAAEEAERASMSAWSDSMLPSREPGEHDEP